MQLLRDEYTANSKPVSLYTFVRLFISALGVFLCIAIAFATYVYQAQKAPGQFPSNSDITIHNGLTVGAVADLLEREHVVGSSLLLYMLIEAEFKGSYIQAGTYRFDSPRTLYEIADAITTGKNLTPLLKVTFPEGFTAKNILQYLPLEYAHINISSALAHEGYLFPDTYFISPDSELNDILALMEETYKQKIALLREKINASPYTEKEVIILASILEREANDVDSMKMVAGILEKRLQIDMPLQVDATFEYHLGKTSKELTAEDLQSDSPYNTYTHGGLPPEPISNPGLNAIHAVLEPTTSEYLYYLTGTDGKFYYAKTFEEHKKNKTLHLK
jgi:UPF0755 protein